MQQVAAFLLAQGPGLFSRFRLLAEQLVARFPMGVFVGSAQRLCIAVASDTDDLLMQQAAGTNENAATRDVAFGAHTLYLLNDSVVQR